LWDPYTYCGIPAYANLGAQVFYPPSMVAYLLSNWLGSGRHLLYILEVETIAHVLLGGIGAMWLLRRLGVGRTASVLGATVYQLGAYFASQTQHVGAVDAAGWLPWAWLAVVQSGVGFRSRRVAVLAVVLAMSFLAGFPAATAVVYGSTMLLAGVLAAFRLARWRSVAWCGAAAALSLALCAVQLIPTMELSGHSVAALRSDWIEGGGGVPLQALATLLWPNRWGVFEYQGGTWALPWNPTFLYLYCSVSALLFAGFAILRKPSRLAIAFAVMTVGGALWMLGGETPVYRLLCMLLPKRVTAALYAEFAMCVFTLALAVLAGMGADRFVRYRARWVHAAVVVVAALELIAAGSGRPINTVDARWEPGVGHDHWDRFPEIPGAVRRLVNENTPPWRIDTMKGSLAWSSSSSQLEVPTASGNDPFALARYIQVRTSFTGGERWGRYYEVRDPDSAILKFLNVRYIISNSALDRPGGLIRREGLPGNVVWENPDPMPRFFLVGRVRSATGMEDAVRQLRAPSFDPRTEAIVEGATVASLAGGTARTLRYAARELAVETESAAPSFLVTSEGWYPGWRAWVDGREQPLVLTNVAFRGLAVPAGRHTVTMRFDPPVLLRSALVTLAAMVVLGLLAIRGAVRDNDSQRVRWTSSSS
jgi:hypothetical protein